MRLFFAALLCLLVSLLDVLPKDIAHIDSSLEQLLRFAVPALLIYIMAEAAFLSRFDGKTVQKTSDADEHGDSSDQLRKVKEEKAALQQESKNLLEEKERLQTAYQELEERFKQARTSAVPTKRDSLVDAELINLLALFQDKGRLLDFLMDDITPYQDAQVGVAARVVHQGCAAVIKEYFKISPIHQGKESEAVSLEKGYNPEQFRLLGSLKGEAPYSGTLLHHGWIAEEVKLPRVVQSEDDKSEHNVIAPAEIEVK